jgi:hypothetical protein
MPRRFPIFQFPNRPLIVAACAAGLSRVTDGQTARASALVSEAGLMVWAYEEIADGANWFRRLLGVTGAAVALTALVRTAGARG